MSRSHKFILFSVIFLTTFLGVFAVKINKVLALSTPGTNVDFRVFIGDTPVPEAPINPTGQGMSNQIIDLSWSPATSSATTTIGYLLYRNGVKIATIPASTSTAITYQDTGLATKTFYLYYVIAYDKFNRWSPKSSALSVTTLDVGELPPEKPKSPIVVVPPVVEPPVVPPVVSTKVELHRSGVDQITQAAIKLVQGLVGVNPSGGETIPLVEIPPLSFRSGTTFRQAVSETISAPVAVSLAGASGLVGFAGNAGSLWEIYLLSIRQFGLILEFFHIRKKQKPWGTVYDSITKRPIDPAYVRVLQGNKEIATTITDIDGRFSFILPPGSYRLIASKTHYSFPSKKLEGKHSDEIYGNLYFGEDLQINSEELVQVSIPIDPIGFDWNEFVKNKEHYFRTHYRLAIFRSYLSWFMYVIGFIASISYVLVKFNWLNAAILALYLAMLSFKIFGRLKKQKPLQVTNQSGQALSFAIIRVFMSGVNQLVKTVVADDVGRFFILVRPGEYYLTVDIKNEDGTYTSVFRSANLNLPDGILKSDIKV